jgi:nicotinamidase-related amidase
MKLKQKLIAAALALVGLTNITNAQLPDPGIEIVAGRTALLITDPQNDFLSPKGVTIISNPHKVYGPETNDLVLQLRKRGIDKVILGGMSANLCTESHMRELMEQGFEVAVVSDATAAAIVAEGRVDD